MLIFKAFKTITLFDISCLILFSDTNLLIAIGKPSCDNDIINKKVGMTIIYTPIPSGVNKRAINILFTRANILTIKPITTKMIVA